MNLAPLRNRDFGLLWVAGLISFTGDWALSVALPIAVYQLTGSAAATSALVAVNVGTRLLFGALAGVYVDRWDRRRVMIWANLLLAAALLPALAVDSADAVWILFGVVFAHSVLTSVVRPAEHALLPRLVGEADLAAANALNGLNNNLARLIGPALGGMVAATYGLCGAVLVDAVSFLLAALLVALIRGRHRATPTPADEAPAGRLRGELAAGLAAIRRSPILRALFVALLITAIGEGVMSSLFAVFVSVALRGGSLQLGWLMSAQAVGGILGGLVATWLAGRWYPARMVAVGLVLFGLTDLVIFNYPRWSTAIAPEIVLFVLVGIPGGVLLAGAMTLLQTEVADALRGRVFAAAVTVESGAMLVGTVIAGTATGPLGVITVLTLQGLGYVVAGVIFGLSSARPRSVVVEAPAGLATQVAGGDHARE